jgi:hypothetical protein
MLELAKLHPCLKEKGRMKSRASTTTVTRGGRANARSQFKDDAAIEHRSLEFLLREFRPNH